MKSEDRYRKLEILANAIHAAGRIRSLYGNLHVGSSHEGGYPSYRDSIQQGNASRDGDGDNGPYKDGGQSEGHRPHQAGSPHRDANPIGTGRNVPARPDQVCLLCDALKIIDSYSPTHRSNGLGDTVNKAAYYGNTYKNLKRHLRGAANRPFDRDMLLGTLNAVKPLLNSRYSGYVDKITQIHRILRS